MADAVGDRRRTAVAAVVPAAGRLQEASGGRVAVRARHLLLAAVRGPGGEGERAGAASRPLTVGECVEVGVPVREAYDRWLEFLESGPGGEAPRGARILWPGRGRAVRVTERIPGDLVVWEARDSRAAVRGVATFHQTAGNLTRVLVVLEYRPRNLLERAARLWHAQARRVRLDLADYQRSVSLGIEIDGGGAAAVGEGGPGDPAGGTDGADQAR
ncbi:hypothetical protein IQ279_11245 [Streptomyces verrucosisporus]|uniref:hypothetical protein n=1 Tax=Streptomyces verrucosisporus TaxID=1695161 RepID=UPI0019CFFF52|nr:hypothetical protein [Streptomyces verrucosisporus]MBN3930201.1 hypothetical protein [Streptomyces verrucosisporus]